MSKPADLPNDVETLKALLVASEDRNLRKQDRIDRLEKLVADFKRALFGARSEKADPEQFELSLEDIETALSMMQSITCRQGMAVVHAEDDALDPPASRPSKPRNTNRGSLPKHLPRIEDVLALDSMTCGCGAERHAIGEDMSERLDIIPSQFRVIVTRRPKYACRSCTKSVVQAPAPAHLIPSGMPTGATVAHVLVSKYADHLARHRFTAAKGSIWIAPTSREGLQSGLRTSSSL